MLAAVLAGKFCAGISPRWLIAGGFVVIAAGLAVVAGHTPFMDPLSAMTRPASLVVPFLVLGAGVGLAIAPLTTAVIARAEDRSYPRFHRRNSTVAPLSPASARHSATS